VIAVNLSRSSPAKRAVRAFRFRISYLIQMNPRPTEAVDQLVDQFAYFRMGQERA